MMSGSARVRAVCSCGRWVGGARAKVGAVDLRATASVPQTLLNTGIGRSVAHKVKFDYEHSARI